VREKKTKCVQGMDYDNISVESIKIVCFGEWR